MNRKLSLVFIGIGIFVTSYLSYLKLAVQESVCLSGGMFNCEAVLNSRYSEVNLLGSSVPIAYLGWLVYLLLLGFWLWEGRGTNKEAPIAIFFGLNTFAWLYSMYLVYLQFSVLRAACLWCLTHEANITVLFALTLLRLRNVLSETA